MNIVVQTDDCFPAYLDIGSFFALVIAARCFQLLRISLGTFTILTNFFSLDGAFKMIFFLFVESRVSRLAFSSFLSVFKRMLGF